MWQKFIGGKIHAHKPALTTIFWADLLHGETLGHESPHPPPAAVRWEPLLLALAAARRQLPAPKAAPRLEFYKISDGKSTQTMTGMEMAGKNWWLLSPPLLQRGRWLLWDGVAGMEKRSRGVPGWQQLAEPPGWKMLRANLSLTRA